MITIIASVVGGIMGLAVIWMVLYNRVGLRYLIHQDWYRAELIGQDGRAFARTFRSRDSDKVFTLKINGRLHTFAKDKNSIVSVTKFNIPKAYYYIGKHEPLNPDGTPNVYEPNEVDSESNLDSAKYTEIARTTIVRDLLTTFKASKLDATSALFIVCGVNLVGLVILGYVLSDKMDKLVR